MTRYVSWPSGARRRPCRHTGGRRQRVRTDKPNKVRRFSRESGVLDRGSPQKCRETAAESRWAEVPPVPATVCRDSIRTASCPRFAGPPKKKKAKIQKKWGAPGSDTGGPVTREAGAGSTPECRQLAARGAHSGLSGALGVRPVEWVPSRARAELRRFRLVGRTTTTRPVGRESPCGHPPRRASQTRDKPSADTCHGNYPNLRPVLQAGRCGRACNSGREPSRRLPPAQAR